MLIYVVVLRKTRAKSDFIVNTHFYYENEQENDNKASYLKYFVLNVFCKISINYHAFNVYYILNCCDFFFFLFKFV